MNGQYVEVDVSDLRKFSEKLHKAAGGDLKKELATFLDGVGFEMLRIIEDQIKRLGAVNTRLLLDSFHKGAANNVYELDEGNLTLEIGTNVEYAKWVNDGHKQVAGRFIPGDVKTDADGKVVEFHYRKGAKTGMMLKASRVKGKHYMEHSIQSMEKMFPKLLEAKIEKWLDGYFSG